MEYLFSISLDFIVLMMMTLMVLWLEPSSTERITLANLNFVLHLLALQDLKWKIFWIGANPPKLRKSFQFFLLLRTRDAEVPFFFHCSPFFAFSYFL